MTVLTSCDSVPRPVREVFVKPKPVGPPPNFVIIIADDMNWDDSGVYGHPRIRTPHIDALAKQGMRFDNAFVTISSCSPSRASIITGRYPHSTDAEQLHWPVPAEQVTFVEQLKAAGYFTAAAGKWHLGEALKSRFDVVKEADPRGFQLSTDADGKPGKMVGGDPSGCKDWLPLLADRPRDKPFLLWLASLDPHRDYEEGIIDPPHQPGDVRLPPYLPDVPAVRHEFTQYYDEINRLDGYVGRVLAELDRQGVADNTFVLFFSDNGRPFPREKTTTYDCGIKTPFIVRFPGRVAAGSVCRSVISTVDIAPTVLQLARLEPLPTFQGVSLVPLLSDPTRQVRRFAFAEDNWHDYEDRARAVRSRRYKYIHNEYTDLPQTPPADVNRSPTAQAMRALRDAGKLPTHQRAVFLTPRPEHELYDTLTDPNELYNLANNPIYAEVLGEMRDALAAWKRDTNDVDPPHRTADEFDRETGRPLPNRVRPRPSKRDMFGP
ncbi:MAG: sulfatase-like hydrolase/transferase [Phycisphaera sp.]|nr:sulfatase-like hydrolase/transferase [Phycisphaera sp.]